MINNKVNSLSIYDETYLLHEIFRKARIKLLLDFIIPKCKPDIHRDMFKYENSSTAMQLIIQKYFLSWIKEHSEICERFVSEQINLSDIDNKKIKDSFNYYFLQLISKFDIKYSNSDIVNFIFTQKEKGIDNLLENNDKVNKQRIELEFNLERQIRLIDRELNNLNL